MIALGLFLTGLGLIAAGWYSESKARDWIGAGASVSLVVIGVWSIVIAGLVAFGQWVWG